MASEINLNAVFTDIANSIRSKKGTTGTIQPINMASEIDSIETGSTEKSTIYQVLERMGTNWGSALDNPSSYNDNLFAYITSISASDIPNIKPIYINYMFRNNKSLVSIPLFDLSECMGMMGAFEGCKSLLEIPAFDVKNCTDFYNIFKNCTSLISIKITNIKRSFDISQTALEHDALVYLINNGLKTMTSTNKLTMGSSKLALLSDSEKQVALDKGWTLA